MAADLEQVTLFGGVVSVTQLTATYNSLPLHSRPLAQNRAPEGQKTGPGSHDREPP